MSSLSPAAEPVLRHRYLRQDEHGGIVETPDERSRGGVPLAIGEAQTIPQPHMGARIELLPGLLRWPQSSV